MLDESASSLIASRKGNFSIPRFFLHKRSDYLDQKARAFVPLHEEVNLFPIFGLVVKNRVRNSAQSEKHEVFKEMACISEYSRGNRSD